MQALARHRPRPLATFMPTSQRSKYQYVRMKDMIRSALGAPPGGSMYANVTTGGENMSTSRGLALGMMGAPGSATTENFPGSAGGMASFGPLSAGLDGPAGGGLNPGSRRQSSISMANPSSAGPRQILPGQLPGPRPQQRKGSMASVTSVGAS